MNAWDSPYKCHQGNIGLGQAIAYYTMNAVPVMIPLNDTQKYDLVIDIDGTLKKVSVKTAQGKENGNFRVELKKSGGASTTGKVRPFDKSTCDILFVYTIEGDIYEIPTSYVNAKSAIILAPQKYGSFKKNM